MTREEIIFRTYGMQFVLSLAIVASIVLMSRASGFWAWINAIIAITNGGLFIANGHLRRKMRSP